MFSIGKRDVYVSMPTGSGKSLCFQLPGMLCENKVTIVFSPLIALIKDQMDHLAKLKICAESLNSKMTVKERERVILDLRSIKPSTKFLYITPEQAATDFFKGLLDSMVKYNKIAFIAVDEVDRKFDCFCLLVYSLFNFQSTVPLCLGNGPSIPTGLSEIGSTTFAISDCKMDSINCYCI